METICKYLDIIGVKISLFTGLVVLTVQDSPQAFAFGALAGVLLLVVVDMLDKKIKDR